MKIIITSKGEQLDSEVDERFSHCKFFIVYNTETNRVEEVIDNPAVENPEDGEKEAARLIVDKEVEALIGGDIEPSAGDILGAGGIRVFDIHAGTVQDAIDRYNADELTLRIGPEVGMYQGAGSPSTSSPEEPKPGEGIGRGQPRDIEPDPGHICICPFCGEVIEAKGASCRDLKCPKCNANLVNDYRKFSQ